MYYVIVGTDIENSLQKRIAARPRHIERIQALAAEDRLLVAGPCPAVDTETPADAGFTGSVIIASFESLGAAQAWAEADPYIEAGVYDSVSVRPFIKVLP